jgi:hypothetical protein
MLQRKCERPAPKASIDFTSSDATTSHRLSLVMTGSPKEASEEAGCSIDENG